MVEPQHGARIHSVDPFAVPEQDRSTVRRFRGRLAATVALWTASVPDGRPAGLTVSSNLVADGEPARLLGVIDPESDLFDAVRVAGLFAVAPLADGQQDLADRFAGLLPAPGGLFSADRWLRTGYGPVLATQGSWAGCRLDSTRDLGWGMLVEATVERVVVADDTDPLVYFRGRYRTLAQRR